MDKVRILIASDHPISRAGLQRILASEQTVDVIGTCALGEAPKKANAENPDVVLVHVAQVGRRTVRIARELLAQGSPVVLVMNSSPHEGVVVSLFRAGVVGFVITRSHPPELVRATQEAVRGRRHIDPGLNERVLDALLQKESQLSPRERQVLHYLALGFTHREISARLNVSTKTVDTYRQRLAEKLNLRSRAEIVHFALTMGILRSEDEGPPNEPG